MGSTERGVVLEPIEELLGLGTFVWEPPGVLWSAGMFRLLGLPVEPVDSMIFFDRVHPEDRARTLMAWRIIVEEGRHEPFHYRVLGADGTPRWVVGRGTVTKGANGELVRMVGTLVDVTEQRAAAEQLADANALLAETQRAAGVGTYVFDFASGRIAASEELVRIVGLPPGTPFDRGTSERLIHPDDRARQVEWGTRVAAGEAPPPLLSRLVRPDGNMIHIESRGRRADGPGGPRMVGVLLDVTTRIELEDQLRHAATMDAIGALAAGIAHDFNNYLTVVALQVERMRNGRGQSGPGELESMAGALDRCAGLVRQLLSFARQHPFRPERCDLASRAAAVAEMFGRLVGPDIDVQVEGGGPLPIEADGAQLDAAIMNLLVNARDAMPGGGKVTMTFSIDGEHARVQIADTGSGIAPEVLPRIFEPYFTTKPEGRGTGLGLAAVYGTVRQHGGSIRASARPGGGTLFDLRLPLVSTAPAARGRTSPRTSFALRILLVEDLDVVRDAIERLLRDEGHQVVTAGDGEHALAAVRGGAEIDVVLSDVVMPRMGGVALARALAEERPKLPVILMSGHAGDADGDGGALRIDKPFSREQLDAALARAVHKLV
jgi:signal transduction histidine kinase/CheY-like chemotaxis protein